MKKIYLILFLTPLISNAQIQNNVDILKSFGINSSDKTAQAYYLVDNITIILQDNYISQGCTSKLFGLWNEMLKNYYPNTTEYLKRCLKPKQDTKTFDPILNSKKNILTTKLNLDKFGIKYDDKDFPIYLPFNMNSDKQDSESISPTEKCQITLVKYLSALLDFGLEININFNSEELLNNRRLICNCANSGAYDDFNIQIEGDVNPKFSIESYGGPYNFKKMDFGEKLEWIKIKKILSGKKIYGRFSKGHNPYEIGYFLN
jgi:hypothetical protein